MPVRCRAARAIPAAIAAPVEAPRRRRSASAACAVARRRQQAVHGLGRGARRREAAAAWPTGRWSASRRRAGRGAPASGVHGVGVQAGRRPQRAHADRRAGEHVVALGREARAPARAAARAPPRGSGRAARSRAASQRGQGRDLRGARRPAAGRGDPTGAARTGSQPTRAGAARRVDGDRRWASAAPRGPVSVTTKPSRSRCTAPRPRPSTRSARGPVEPARDLRRDGLSVDVWLVPEPGARVRQIVVDGALRGPAPRGPGSRGRAG